MAVDTARKLVFGGVAVNVIAAVFPAVGTIALFQRFQSLLVLLGFDAFIGWILVAALFGLHVFVGMIAPIVAVREVESGHWSAVALIFVGGVMTVLYLGGVLLVVAGVLFVRAGPVETYSLPYAPETDVAEALKDQRSPPRPANTCPICGATLAKDDTICAACHRRSSIRG